jgi:hypothetical protein
VAPSLQFFVGSKFFCCSLQPAAVQFLLVSFPFLIPMLDTCFFPCSLCSCLLHSLPRTHPQTPTHPPPPPFTQKTYTPTHTHIHPPTPAPTLTHPHTQTKTRTHTHTHTSKNTHTHTPVHPYTHTHTHTHTPAWELSASNTRLSPCVISALDGRSLHTWGPSVIHLDRGTCVCVTHLDRGTRVCVCVVSRSLLPDSVYLLLQPFECHATSFCRSAEGF